MTPTRVLSNAAGQSFFDVESRGNGFLAGLKRTLRNPLILGMAGGFVLNQLQIGLPAPVMNVLGIPPELTELMLIRPLSGAGALGILENIFTQYGADSYIGKCASVIYGSSETVFYISTIYFSQSNVKKLGYAIPVALFATLVGCVAGCAIARL